ncbi:MAG: penicillin amidase [Granulosicoccus sp.]|jgi:penicillin amidase
MVTFARAIHARIMKYLKAFLLIAMSLLFTLFLNNRIGVIPALGVFFDPHGGFWQNAEFESELRQLDISSLVLEEPATVILDVRGVPHVFAKNDRDLYYLQGFLTAKDRLWQMEFQTHAAAGRLSEIIGEKALGFDLEQRRIGMVTSAQTALNAFKDDTVCVSAVQAYTDGVNAFISTVDRKSIPLEYRMLDYSPELWTPLKCSLLLKYMAKMLNGGERDFENTALLQLLGQELFDELYPEQYLLSDPVIDSTYSALEDSIFRIDLAISLGSLPEPGIRQPKNIGSNNWAVSGSRTKSGNPMLANDPHLKLSLPSIWYEIQLNAPGINCYGISLPGAPGITVGFNDQVAWGVTNAGQDVKDHYSIEFRDDTQSEYKVGDEWVSAEKRVDTIKVRGGPDVLDTIVNTRYGPVAFNEEDHQIAQWWSAHSPSNEFRAFYQLNRASNLSDYNEALKHYQCPAQNFAFIDNQNIALRHRGSFPAKRKKGHGRFVLDGTKNDPLPKIIPFDENPVVINPPRGFVSSANQAPTDSTYPYYYTGVFEEFRNRTINRVLQADSSITIKDMMDLQSNSYNLLAAEALPLMLEILDTNMFVHDSLERLSYSFISDWDYLNTPGSIGATVFQIWWDELNGLIYDELNSKLYQQENYYDDSWKEMMLSKKAYIDLKDSRYEYPLATVTINLLRNNRNHPIFDHLSTPEKNEDAKQIVFDALYWASVKLGDIVKYGLNEPHWGLYQDTRLRHLARVDALGSPNLFIGGNENAPNAMTSTHGPSWRMVVEMTETGPKAFGVFPGGQSGNPGSSDYLYSLDKWMNGEYHELEFWTEPDAAPRNNLRYDIAP